MSTATTVNNKRIAKNTLLLYIRMLFQLAISLYTSRVILEALGVEDFGIYNVVGGVVTMFTMFSGALSAAITRFVTFELGKGNIARLNSTFSSSVTIQIGLGLIILFLIEVAGVWFLNARMNMPVSRLTAANWVLQLSAVTFFFNLITIPYNAEIVAHERMSVFAYISIFESLAKLGIAYLIIVAPFDRLIFYAILMCMVALCTQTGYRLYCKRHFEECRYKLSWDGKLLKQMFGFAGWNFIGVTSGIASDQGVNIVINLFHGPAVNAARGVAMQVNNAILGFVANFQMALNPQITKSYATGEHDYMMKLVFQGSRLSYYMMLLISLPVLVNTRYVLGLWLHDVPQHTVLFVQLILLCTLSETLSGPLITAMLATGKIRNYQIVVGGIRLLNLPFSYLLLRWGYRPEYVVLVAIINSQCCLAARLLLLRVMINLKVRQFMKYVYMNVAVVTGLSSILPVLISLKTADSLQRFICLSILCVLLVISCEFYIGCNKEERQFVTSKANLLLERFIHHGWRKG